MFRPTLTTTPSAAEEHAERVQTLNGMFGLAAARAIQHRLKSTSHVMVSTGPKQRGTHSQAPPSLLLQDLLDQTPQPQLSDLFDPPEASTQQQQPPSKAAPRPQIAVAPVGALPDPEDAPDYGDFGDSEWFEVQAAPDEEDEEQYAYGDGMEHDGGEEHDVF